MLDKLSIDCIHPSIEGHRLLGEMFWEDAKHIFSKPYLKNFDFSGLAPKCVNERGYGKTILVGYGFCAKKSEDVVDSNELVNFCRVTSY